MREPVLRSPAGIVPARRTVERGGAVEFGAVRDRVVFEVNLPAAEQAGLKVSSDLLSHARKVYR